MAVQLNPAFTSRPTDPTSATATPPQPPRRTVGKKLEAIIELKTFAKTLEGVEVPYWVGLATEDVELLLKEKKSPFFEDWKKLKELYEACPEKKKFLENPEAKKLIEQIQQEIHGAVKERPWGQQWNLSSDVYWMVRSSGAEDGAVACAGYNLSLDYRLPHQMGQSIADVLSSYYNAEGAEARIQRGLNPFEKYHLSLFVQELIGEKMGGETQTALIPKSAVVFTNEPMYVQGQQWRVMKIVTTHGHCSAITDNRGIATETIYILQGKDGKIYVVYDHVPKPERLAPVDGKLDVVPNPKEIVYEPVLDAKMLERLFDLGIKMEQFFGDGARDSELVIKNGIIYLLQSRPVNRSISKAVYLDMENPRVDAKEMKVVVPGHYNAFTLKESKDLLNVDNLIDAPNEDYKLVVVHQDEPANSHPIVNFSEREIPVFLNPEEIDPPSNGEVLAICPQQGVVGRGTSNSFEFKEGYTDHPAPIAFGKRDLQKMSSADTAKVAEIIKQVRTAKEKAVALKALESLQPHLKNFNERLVQAKAFAEPAKELKALVDRTLDELKAAFDRGQRLEVLFYAKALKVLLIDPQFSVLSLTELLKRAQEYETSVARTADLACISVIPAINEQIRGRWMEFLKQAEQFPEKHQLLHLLGLLGDKKSLWLTFYFDSHFKKASSPQELMQSLLQDIDGPSHEFINKLPQVISRPSTRLFDFFKSEEFKQGFKNSKPLARTIALDRLFIAVDLYDKLLKGIKMNLKLPFGTKMKEFKESFAPYYFLMDHVAREIVVENRSLHWNIISYLGELKSKYVEIMNKEETPALLQTTANFTVAGIALGSQAALERHPFETVEELFTIAHQNLLALIASQYKENLPPLEDLTLPDLLRDAVKELNQMPRRVQHIGVVQNEEELVFQFNIPLNNHSSTCQLKYKDGKLFLCTQLIGQGRDRWPAINNYLRILHELGIQPFEKLIYRRDFVDVTWALSKPEDAHNACNLMECMYNRSFTGSNNVLIDHFSSRVKGEIWVEKRDQILKMLHSADDHKRCLLLELMGSTTTQFPLEPEIWEMVDKLLTVNNVDLRHSLFQFLSNIAIRGSEEDRKKCLQISLNHLNSADEASAVFVLVTLVNHGFGSAESLEAVQKVKINLNTIRLLMALSNNKQTTLPVIHFVLSFFSKTAKINESNVDDNVISAVFSILSNHLEEVIAQGDRIFDLLDRFALDETMPNARRSLFNLYTDLVHRGFAPASKAYLLPQFAKTNDTVTRIGVQIFMNLLTKQYLYEYERSAKSQEFANNAKKEMAEVAKIFIQDEHPENKLAAVKWLCFLVRQGFAYQEAKDALSYLSTIPNLPAVSSIELMLHLVDKKQVDAQTLLKAGYLQKQEDQQLFMLMDSLFNAQPKEVAAILGKTLSVTQVNDICSILRNGNIDKCFLFCEIAKTDPRFIKQAFNEIQYLFSQKRIQKEAIEMVEIIVKNKESVDRSVIEDAIVMLMELTAQGVAIEEAKAAIGELSGKADQGFIGTLLSNLKQIMGESSTEKIQKILKESKWLLVLL